MHTFKRRWPIRTFIDESPTMTKRHADSDPAETQEWLESLDYAMDRDGPDRVQF